MFLVKIFDFFNGDTVEFLSNSCPRWFLDEESWKTNKLRINYLKERVFIKVYLKAIGQIVDTFRRSNEQSSSSLSQTSYASIVCRCVRVVRIVWSGRIGLDFHLVCVVTSVEMWEIVRAVENTLRVVSHRLNDCFEHVVVAS